MNAALGWIGDLVRWIGALVPRITNVRATHGAVKFKRGRVVPVVPGLVWHWPIVTDLYVVPTARRSLQLNCQVVPCADGWPIAVSSVIVYRLTDLVAACGRNYEIRSTIEDVAQGALMRAAAGTTINADLGELGQRLRSGCQEELGPHGVQIEVARIVDWTRVVPFKQYRDWSHAFQDDEVK